MELLGALATGWMTLLILTLSWMAKGRIDRLESRIDTGLSEVREENRAEVARLRSEMMSRFESVGSEIGSLRSEMMSGFESVRAEIATLRSEHGAEISALRSDVTQIALALGARQRDTG